MTDSARRRAEGAEAESALEREIEAALAVDPSPQFVAKIRARVASEPAPTSWWPLRWPVLATAAASAVVAVAVASMWQPSAPEQSATLSGADVVLTGPAPEQPARATPERTAAPRVPSPATVARTSSHSTRSVARTVSGPREPEVLISRDEQRAFALLVTAVHEGRFQRALASTAKASDTWAEPMDISITPLVIEPLPQIAALGGEEQ